MQGLHENQKTLLSYLLNCKEGATLDEISAELGITKSAAKEHIIKVERLGYISYRDAKGLVGRPRRRYLLSEDGQETFPRQYLWFSNILLDFLAKNLGSEAITQIMSSLAQKVVASMAERFQSKSNAELLSEISKVLNELGYRTHLKQSDLRKTAIIEATNCVYHSVAKMHPALCTFDVELIKGATGGMDVTQESCIAKGDATCRFCIRKKPSNSNAPKL